MQNAAGNARLHGRPTMRKLRQRSNPRKHEELRSTRVVEHRGHRSKIDFFTSAWTRIPMTSTRSTGAALSLRDAGRGPSQPARFRKKPSGMPPTSPTSVGATAGPT
jgi:hypothetical protein